MNTQNSGKTLPDVFLQTAPRANQLPRYAPKVGLDHTMFVILVQLLDTPLLSAADLAALLALPRRTVLRRLTSLETEPYRFVTHWTPGCIGIQNTHLYLLTERGRAMLFGSQTAGRTQRAERFEAIARSSGAHPFSLLRLIPRLPAVVAAQRVCTDLLAAASSALANPSDSAEGMTITARRWLRYPRYVRQVEWLDHPLRLAFDGVLFLRCRARGRADDADDGAGRNGYAYPAGDDEYGNAHFMVGVWLDDGESNVEQIAARFWRLLTYRDEKHLGSEEFPRIVITTARSERTELWQTAATMARAKRGGWMPEGVIVEALKTYVPPWPLTVLGELLSSEPDDPVDGTDNTTDGMRVPGDRPDGHILIDLVTGRETSLASAFDTLCDKTLWMEWQQPAATACAIAATAPFSVAMTPSRASSMVPPKDGAPKAQRDREADSLPADITTNVEARRSDATGSNPNTPGRAEQQARMALPQLPTLLEATPSLLASDWAWADQLPQAATAWIQTLQQLWKDAVHDHKQRSARIVKHLRGAEHPQVTRNEKDSLIADADAPSSTFHDPWETLTPLRRQLARCGVLLRLQRLHLDILALMGIAPLISTADVAFWLRCSEATIRRRIRDIRVLGLCDEVLLPPPPGGLPSTSSHQVERGSLTCLRLRPAGRALLAAIYGRAAHQVPFRLRDIATPTAHDTGVHRFHTLLAIASRRRATLGDPSDGFVGEWWCDEEHCSLAFDTTDRPFASSTGATDYRSLGRRRVIPDAIGEWRWIGADGEEHSTALWLEWDTGAEGEAKIREKLERYTMYIQQLKLNHWADDNYQAPLLFFVVPDPAREAWLAAVVHDVIVEWTSWQGEQERTTQKVVKAQPYPTHIYCTTVMHLSEAAEGPLSSVWLQIAPKPLERRALQALEEAADHAREQRQQEQSGEGNSRQSQSLQQRKGSQHRLHDLVSAAAELWHTRQAQKEQTDWRPAHQSAQRRTAFQQTHSPRDVMEGSILPRSCPLEIAPEPTTRKPPQPPAPPSTSSFPAN